MNRRKFLISSAALAAFPIAPIQAAQVAAAAGKTVRVFHEYTWITIEGTEFTRDMVMRLLQNLNEQEIVTVLPG